MNWMEIEGMEKTYLNYLVNVGYLEMQLAVVPLVMGHYVDFLVAMFL